MICKSLLLLFIFLSRKMSWTPHASYCFFTYDSHIVYRLFLYILLPYCIYHTSHVTDTWILLESLCETCGQFIYLFPLRHVLLASSCPYYCIICAISMCFHMSTVWCMLSVHVWYTYVLYWYLSSCTDIHMYILIFHENCSLYCILLHIIYCKITLIIFMAHIFSTIIYHMNFYHMQSTLCFMYYKCFGTVYHYLLQSFT